MCAGTGWVDVSKAANARDAEAAGHVGEFVRAWGLIQKYGVDGWKRLENLGDEERLDAWFGEAVGFMDALVERARARAADAAK